MTQREFETRVNMEVSSSEFDSINDVYMNCDLDKDEFCKMWVKMNKSRVAKAAAERKEAEQKIADQETAYELYTRLMNIRDYSLAVANINAKEENFIKRIGINLQEWSSWLGCNVFRSAMSVGYDLGVFCGVIRA